MRCRKSQRLDCDVLAEAVGDVLCRVCEFSSHCTFHIQTFREFDFKGLEFHLEPGDILKVLERHIEGDIGSGVIELHFVH